MKRAVTVAEQAKKGEVKVVSGNYAASYGAKLARAEVVSAFPITPQTSIVEKLAEMVATGEMQAKFVPAESEHSVMAVLIGAASVGARCFTATSSQGLALMHELVHWAGRGRLPIVMVNCNRALAAPWGLGAEQDDSLSQRDTGWLQFYCESNQEVLDTVIQAFKIAEEVSLPVMLCLDGFYLTHTSEPVWIPDIEVVDQYLPRKDRKFRLDPDAPLAFATDFPAQKLKFELAQTMEMAKTVVKRADQEFEDIFGRSYGLTELYRAEDADVILVTSSTMSTTARHVVNNLRESGQRVGLLKVRMFRPFPKEEVTEALRHVSKVAVIDRNMSYGHGGVFAMETKAAMYEQEARVPIFEFIAGMGGTDVTPAIISQIFEYTFKHDVPEGEPVWMGMSIQ